MIAHHPSFQAPENRNIAIWRYMDLTRFLWLLQARALYFARADKLGDPYEGHYTEHLKGDDETVVRRIFGRTHFEPNELQSLPEKYRQTVAFEKMRLFVNCWHMNEEESEAMWRLYANHHSSVCIRSDYSRLANILPEGCFLGCVNYVDYKSYPIPVGNLLNYIIHKRLSFAHERELRAVIWSTHPGADCSVVPISLNDLITEVYVSPTSDATLLPIVRELCQKYEIAAPVFQSGVNAPPAY